MCAFLCSPLGFPSHIRFRYYSGLGSRCKSRRAACCVWRSRFVHHSISWRQRGKDSGSSWRRKAFGDLPFFLYWISVITVCMCMYWQCLNALRYFLLFSPYGGFHAHHSRRILPRLYISIHLPLKFKVEMEQELSNHLNAKRFREAVRVALALKQVILRKVSRLTHSHTFLLFFRFSSRFDFWAFFAAFFWLKKRFANRSVRLNSHWTMNCYGLIYLGTRSQVALDSVLGKLPASELGDILLYVRDWNTNSRHRWEELLSNTLRSSALFWNSFEYISIHHLFKPMSFSLYICFIQWLNFIRFALRTVVFSFIAQSVLQVLLRAYSPTCFSQIPNMKSIVAGLLPYTGICLYMYMYACVYSCMHLR